MENGSFKNQPQMVIGMFNANVDIPEFAENLAYDISEKFGDRFTIWLGEDKNRNAGAETKVRY